MIIDRQKLFTVVFADADKLLTNGQNVYQLIYIPKHFADQEIKAKYSEVDKNDFELKIQAQKQDGVYTKLFIRRACRALGLQAKLNTLLKSNEYFSADWADAQQINLNDPMFVEALKQGTFTQQEIESIKKYQ